MKYLYIALFTINIFSLSADDKGSGHFALAIDRGDIEHVKRLSQYYATSNAHNIFADDSFVTFAKHKISMADRRLEDELIAFEKKCFNFQMYTTMLAISLVSLLGLHLFDTISPKYYNMGSGLAIGLAAGSMGGRYMTYTESQSIENSYNNISRERDQYRVIAKLVEADYIRAQQNEANAVNHNVPNNLVANAVTPETPHNQSTLTSNNTIRKKDGITYFEHMILFKD